jgi:release factor glutamine methyltransferase
MTKAELARVLAAAGCVAAEEEAAMLVEAAGAEDGAALDAMVARRVTGEPVEWIVGWAPFCGLRVALGPGVYVPRVQTEVLARRAMAIAGASSAPDLVAVDLATGCGAIAVAMRSVASAAATIIATELDPLAGAWAKRNGVDVVVGDLDEPLHLPARVDVMTANVPYVPTSAIPLLPRDVVAFEPRLALDGGPDGLDVVRRVAAAASRCLRDGGVLLVEIGPSQADGAAAILGDACTFHRDDDGDIRCIERRY